MQASHGVLPQQSAWGRKDMLYLTTHSTHFIYGYMASDIWLWTTLIVRKETRCRHMGYSFRLTARALLYAPSLRQDSTYHSLCYTSCGALAGTRNSSIRKCRMMPEMYWFVSDNSDTCLSIATFTGSSWSWNTLIQIYIPVLVSYIDQWTTQMSYWP